MNKAMRKKRIVEITVLITLTVLIIFIAGNKSNTSHSESNEFAEVNTPKLAYGIVVDSMIIYKDKVKKNQFLADILLKYDVDYSVIDLLVKRSKPVFDVRHIRVGNKYSVLCNNDSAQQ